MVPTTVAIPARGGRDRAWAASKGGGGFQGDSMSGYRKGKGKTRGRGSAQRCGSKSAPWIRTVYCWNHKKGRCWWGAECYFSHDPSTAAGKATGRSDGDGASTQDGGPPEVLKRRFVAQCAAEAWKDMTDGVTEYPQALAVRLALRFEERPADILDALAQAGLPAGADQRSTVKALLRLCHPDKCRHPEAKRAVQILGPLLGRAP